MVSEEQDTPRSNQQKILSVSDSSMFYFALKKQGFFFFTFYPNTSNHAWWANVKSAVLNLYSHHLQLEKNQ